MVLLHFKVGSSIIDTKYSDTLPGTGAKRIYSLKTAQDPQNYGQYVLPKNVEELKVTVKEEVWPGEEIIWTNKPPKKVGRKRQPQLFRGSNPDGQVVEEYRHLKTPIEVFDHLFDQQIMEIILGISEITV